MKTYRDLYHASRHPDTRLISTLDALEDLNPSCLGEDYPQGTYEDPGPCLDDWLQECRDLGLLTNQEARFIFFKMFRYSKGCQPA